MEVLITPMFTNFLSLPLSPSPSSTFTRKNLRCMCRFLSLYHIKYYDQILEIKYLTC
jgi:hypothetical protein